MGDEIIYKNIRKNKEITLTEVLFFCAFNNDVFLYTDTDEIKIEEKLYEIEDKYLNNGFIRVNKSYVVNILQVKEIQSMLNYRLKLVLNDGTNINVNRSYMRNFKDFLRGKEVIV